MRRDVFNSLVSESNFKELFITEMGWNNPKGEKQLPVISVDDNAYLFTVVAMRNGFQILTCNVESLPTMSTCRKIDIKLRRQAEDYICIYILQQTAHHLWVCPVKTNEKREPVLVEYADASKADFLFSKTDGLSFSVADATTIVDVKKRVAEAFSLNSERITKSFYENFQKEHLAFAKFISGIDDHIADKNNRQKQWYTSVMLNRLMFCYFIQKKGFLDNDTAYLRNKLNWVKQEQGEDRFYSSFYRGFLLRLFHGGLNSPRHDRDFEKVYGRIPYLNGGMFDVHQLERDFDKIDIKDEAFERLFDFFDQWQWHLDTRITASGKDINPDVLGYIFEKYINDRAAMGAYYTKEDITDYISKNCILPFLIDKVAQSSSASLFKPDGFVWRTVRDSGDRYIYDAVKQGYSPDWQQRIPSYVAVGLDVNVPGLLERRSRWNEKTDEPFALPTEIWRETVERLSRCDSLLKKISGGEVCHINDFISLNLNIRLFVQDMLETTNDHIFIRNFYHALQQVTILDPTCGSGAFLFAALNILEPFYETCISRMHDFQEQNPRLFRDELGEIASKYRSNIQYFIYKSIILRNLYGVDIMVEATEIAKLRLFLKMVAVVEVDRYADNMGLDPLPDVDFNIRCGNTLVGYASEDEVLNNVKFGGNVFTANEFREKIEGELMIIARTYKVFKDLQLTQEENAKAYREAKQQLNERLKTLNDMLNHHLHEATAPNTDYSQWLASHQPFHWVAEFYQIIKGNGGFDVIIGNPPYVEYKKKNKVTKKSVEDQYKLTGYATIDCGNLYAYVIERCKAIMSDSTYMGMIVPISIVSTDGFYEVRNLFAKSNMLQWYSNYSMRPGKLFDGVEKHLSIFIITKNSSPIIYSTKYYRWYTEYRKNLFNCLYYSELSCKIIKDCSIPKVGDIIGVNILSKICNDKRMDSSSCSKSEHSVYFTRKLRYFVQFLDKAPIIKNEDGTLRVTSELKSINYDTEEKQYAAIAVYLSTLFFWYFISYSDCRNLNKREVDMFPFSLYNFDSIKHLFNLSQDLMDNLQKNSTFCIANYKNYGKLTMQVFQPRLSKPIIDEIDKALAKHYGFTDEELDFIINYDIKYRMGEELNADE